MKESADRPETVSIFFASTGRVEEVETVVKSEQEWKKGLPSEAFKVTRKKGTERAFSNAYWNKHESGVYLCVCCGTDLFASDAKYESGTGWPSFWQPLSPLNVRLDDDYSFFVHRVEVLCSRCGAHLGHLFDDGPPPWGKRYCINSAALSFVQQPSSAVARSTVLQKATFAAGCFWGVEASFRQVHGVVSTRVGYTGGTTRNPTYEDVCTGTTRHAESVEVTFDPAEVSYAGLLDVFWQMHDPTTPDRQGVDVGSQYRSVIFYLDDEQKIQAMASRQALETSHQYPAPLVTEIIPAGEFWMAEEHHQRYAEKHPGQVICHNPKKTKKRQ